MSEFAFDTEANSGFVYDERLCLLQFNVDGFLWVADPLAFDDPSWFEPLAKFFAESRPGILLHGGEFDVSCFKRDFGLQIRGIWDTQQAATFLGREKTGYGSLVLELCGVDLPKEFTRFNWGRRPLPDGPVRYALDDVVYLPELAAALRKEVDARDLTEEVALAGLAVESAEWPDLSPENLLWRIKGLGRLGELEQRRALAVLQWRERIARDENEPPGRILNNRALLTLAQRPPRSPRDLRFAGIHGRVRDRFGRQLVEVLKRRESDLPGLPQRPVGRQTSDVERVRAKRIRSWKRRESAARGVPQQAVLPTTAADYLVRHGAEDLQAVPQLGAKRIRLYGAKLRELCQVGG